MTRVKVIAGHIIAIFKKEHLPLKKRAALCFGYLRVTGKRFLLGRIPFLDGMTASFLGFKINVGLFSDFYWTFVEIFIEEDYYFATNNPRPRIIDCGANIGIATLYFKWLYPKAEIVAFEIEPDNIKIYEKNIESNKLKNVTLHKKAVGGHSGPVILYGNRRAGTISTTLLDEQVKKDQSYEAHCVEVDMVLLSNYIHERIDFLKMDIEGAESDVFVDLSETGTLKYVENTTLEFHRFSSGENKLSTITKALEDYNFDIIFPHNFNALSEVKRSYYNYMIRAGKRKRSKSL